jgi:hypothetical protein
MSTLTKDNGVITIVPFEATRKMWASTFALSTVLKDAKNKSAFEHILDTLLTNATTTDEYTKPPLSIPVRFVSDAAFSKEAKRIVDSNDDGIVVATYRKAFVILLKFMGTSQDVIADKPLLSQSSFRFKVADVDELLQMSYIDGSQEPDNGQEQIIAFNQELSQTYAAAQVQRESILKQMAETEALMSKTRVDVIATIKTAEQDALSLIRQ